VVVRARSLNRTPLSSWLDPLGLSSAGLPVPYQGTTCAWTSIRQVGSQWVRSLAGFRFPAGGRICSDSASLSSP